MTPNNFAHEFLKEAQTVLSGISHFDVEQVVSILHATREARGRLFLCGSGGGAAHASHAACDFRKLAGIEAYSVSDNVAELTARVNDEGWEVTYSNWLRVSNLCDRDCLFIFSVGGGDEDHNISPNLVSAMNLAREVKAPIVGVAGRDGGTLKKLADACVLVPTVSSERVTAHTESVQAVLWHLMVSHPLLLTESPKWESTEVTHTSVPRGQKNP